MDSPVLFDAIFQLGSISGDPTLTNECLLRRVAQVIVRGTGVEAAALAVFENGIEQTPSLVRSIGHWPDFEADRASDDHDPAAGERSILGLVRQLSRERFSAGEFVGEGQRRCERVYSEFHRPMRLVDHALAVFRRDDGVECVIVIRSAPNAEPLGRDTLALGAIMATAAAQCWASAWRREPVWMATLSASSRRVLENLLEGCDDDQIAERTGLTYHSVRAHLKRIFRDAGVRSRLHLIQQCRSVSRGVAETPAAIRPTLPIVTVNPTRPRGVLARTG
jgi:DNA-binding CsgD family transcriptional regulator